MRVEIVALLLGQTTEQAAEQANGATAKLADVGAEFQEKVLQAGSAQEMMGNLAELSARYLVPFAINLIAAIAIFVVGRWVARFLTRVVRRLFERAKVDKTLEKFLCNIVYGLMLTVVVIAALERLGVDTTSFAAILAAAGLAIGFALKGSLANFAAGGMLILFKPFKVGDFVDAGGVKGTIEEIHLFHTFMRTGDNVQIIIPNDAVIGTTITNFSAKPTRRIDLVVSCGYSDDLREVKQLLTRLLAAEGRILPEPEPVIAVNELAESGVNFVVRPWVKSEDYWSTRWDLTEAIKHGFDTCGFNIPFPARDVFLHGESGAASNQPVAT